MDIREFDLPGVGKKFAIMTDANDRMTVIVHNTGHREIYHFQKGENFPFHAIRLESAEARRFGALLSSGFLQAVLAEPLEAVFEQLAVEWMPLDRQSPVAGRSLGDAGIRERTGASVMAILRDGRAHPNPQPEAELASGDLLLVVGDPGQVARCRELLGSVQRAEMG